MRVAGAVLHVFAGVGDHRPPQNVVHPVPAAHPRAVVVEAGRGQPRTHGQQILDRDPALAGIRVTRQLGEVGRDRLTHARNEAPLDGDADQRRDDALRHRLDVGDAPTGRPLREVLEERLSVLRDDQAAQARQPGRRVAGRVERRRRGTLAVRAIDREEKDEGQSDEGLAGATALPSQRQPHGGVVLVAGTRAARRAGGRPGSSARPRARRRPAATATASGRFSGLR